MILVTDSIDWDRAKNAKKVKKEQPGIRGMDHLGKTRSRHRQRDETFFDFGKYRE